MTAAKNNVDEVQFVVGEDWSFGPSKSLVAIPVINGDISKQMIKADSIEGLASKCAAELHSCLIICKKTPLLQTEYLRNAGDERSAFVVKPRDDDLPDRVTNRLADYSGE